MPTPYNKMTLEQKQKANARKERWRLKNRDKVLIYKQKHYYNNRDKYLTIERNRNYQKLYGITIADYDAMFIQQGGVCAMCGTDKAGKNNQFFAVDHDHLTGFVRGLLCVSCNVFLGKYEKKGMVQMAEDYLNRNIVDCQRNRKVI